MCRGKDPRRRARAGLLWTVGLFALMQMVGGLLLDYAWPLVRFPSAAGVMERLKLQPSPPEIVFLGSSRFEAGIRSEEIASLLPAEPSLGRAISVFNAAVPGGDAISAEHLLDRLHRAGARPRLLVIEVSPETLSRHNEWLAFHVGRQLRWEHLPTYLAQICRSGQTGRLLSARFSPVFIHRQRIRQAVVRALSHGSDSISTPPVQPVPQPVDWDALLQPPHREVTPELRRQIDETAGLPRRWLRDFAIGGGAPAALERIETRGPGEGYRVLLVVPPVTQAHRTAYTPEIEHGFRAYLDVLRERFHCPVVDCREWMEDGLFVDNHHLNGEGSLYFSRLLTYRVLSPLWREVCSNDRSVVTRGRP